MSLTAGTATGHAAYWSERLFSCLQAMAARRTNAALLTLAGIEQPECGRRYPESGLTFAGGCWRAYYHCHEAGSRPAAEHGHFHIFTAAGKQVWTHVAGLSIDAMGQPLQWFAVNRWVTDGPWMAAANLLSRLNAATGSEADDLVGRWLLALLQLDRSGLSDLLARRDSKIERHAGSQDPAAVLGDRALYTLATRDIDVPSLLEDSLVHPATAGPDCWPV